MRLWELCQSTELNTPEVMKKARELQALISRADWAASNANVGLADAEPLVYVYYTRVYRVQ